MISMRKVGLIPGAFIVLSVFTPAIAPAEPQRYDYAITTEADKLIGESQKQLTNIRICLNTITPIIKKNDTYQKETLEKIVTHFQELDTVLERFEKRKFTDTDAVLWVQQLLNLNGAVIDHINTALQTNFKDIGSYDVNALIQKAMGTRLALFEPKNIEAQLIGNNKKLELLTKKAQGLRWYNHAVRWMDEKVVTPCQKYSIPRRALLTAGIVSLLEIAWWSINDTSHKHWHGSWFPGYDSWIGPHPVYSVNGTLTNKEQLGHLGNIYHQWSLWASGFTVAGFLFTYVKGGLQEESKNVSPKLKKYADILKNKLKGGVYHKEAERAADKVEYVRFKDIFGQDEIKRYLQHLVDYLENPEAADRLGLTPPKGILLIGDTRTGKTHCVNALFGEVNDMLERTGQADKYTMYRLDAHTIQNEGIDALLKAVKFTAPCIVFIDEIDLLFLQRAGANKTLSEFLQAMGDAVNSKDSKKQVIVIAATNRPETLDIALRQPGRFGKELRFEYPNYEDRLAFLKTKLAELTLHADEFDVAKLAKYTENKSYEALSMLVKNSIIKARLRNVVLNQEILNESLDEDIYHIIPNYTKQIPQHELDILAAHFAGQALALHLMDSSVQLAKVTIKQVMTELKEEFMWTHLLNDKAEKKEQQRFEYGKIFTCHERDSINMNDQETKRKLCKMYLAGFIAEELLLGSSGYSCHAETDKQNALLLAKSIAFEGLDAKTMPEQLQQERYTKSLAIMEQCTQEVKELLTKNKDLLKRLKDALLEHKTLDHDQVKELLKMQETK